MLSPKDAVQVMTFSSTPVVPNKRLSVYMGWAFEECLLNNSTCRGRRERTRMREDVVAKPIIQAKSREMQERAEINV